MYLIIIRRKGIRGGATFIIARYPCSQSDHSQRFTLDPLTDMSIPNPIRHQWKSFNHSVNYY